MEQIIVAAVIIFLLLFGVLTLGNAFIQAQLTLETSWEEMNSRESALNNTALAPVELRVLNGGTLIEVTVRNSGAVKLADYKRWDVFAEYFETGADDPIYHSTRLTYKSAAPGNNEWTMGGIFIDPANDIAETYDPAILNSGEAAALQLYVSPAVGVGETARVTVATENGVTASLVGTRNAPPNLTINSGVKIAIGSGAVITPAMLLAEDIDNSADELTYTIVTPPAQGTITPDDTFTQAQIDDNALVYTHTGAEADSFAFTISDGIDTVGPFAVTISLDKSPVLATMNPGMMMLAGTTATITSALLQTNDDDDLPENVIYTITQLPSDGALSLGSTFSQADINNNRLTYTHVGTDADMFKFVVSDGYDVIGAYTFLITLVETTEEP